MSSTAHSPQKIKLCEHVLLVHFGPIAARIGALLLKRGRLTIREIQRFLNQAPTRTNRGPTDPFTNASTTHTKSTLVSAPIAGASTSYNTGDPNAPVPVPKLLIEQTILTLIQHGCAWHSSTDPDVADPSQEFFEININDVLLRPRFGRYIGIAEDELGDTSARIVKLVLQHGKLQASDIIDRIASEMHTQQIGSTSVPPDAAANGEPPNGTANGSHKRKADDELAGVQAEVARALTVMLFRTYLRPSSVHQYVSPRDKEIKYEAKRRRELRGIPTPKDLQRIREEVRVQIAEEREADWDFAATSVSLGPDGLAAADHRETRRGLVRKKQSAIALASAASKSKRSKSSSSAKDKKAKDKAKDRNGLNGVHSVAGAAEGFDPADDYEIDPSVWLRVHYDRFDVHVRDEIMVDAVREKYNNTAAEVFRQLIHAGDSSMRALGARRAQRTHLDHHAGAQAALGAVAAEGLRPALVRQGQVGAAYQAGVPRRVLRHLFARRRRLGQVQDESSHGAGVGQHHQDRRRQQGGVVAHGRVCQCGGAHASRSAAQRGGGQVWRGGDSDHEHPARQGQVGGEAHLEARLGLDFRDARSVQSALPCVAVGAAGGAQDQGSRSGQDVLSVVCRRGKVPCVAAGPSVPESGEDQSEEERRDAQTAAAATQGREERCQAGYRGVCCPSGNARAGRGCRRCFRCSRLRR